MVMQTAMAMRRYGFSGSKKGACCRQSSMGAQTVGRLASTTFQKSHLTTKAHVQDAADKAEKNADPLAEKATNKAGEAAHTAVKTTHQKWEEVKPEEKVDQYAEKASKTVQASLEAFGRSQSPGSGRRH